MAKYIEAKVNQRLLTRVSRFFVGNKSGRVIEALHNARRAGAKNVTIGSAGTTVTIHDDGYGISDFSLLLDLGASGWDEQTAASEDPAGFGLYCFAPHTTTIRSNGRRVTLTEDVWHGRASALVEIDPSPISGTLITFSDPDGAWTPSDVEPYATFMPMTVTLNGTPITSRQFLSDKAVDYPALGCRIEIVPATEVLTRGISVGLRSSGSMFGTFGSRVALSFHGLLMPIDAFRNSPLDRLQLAALIELTGEPTPLRFLLPARVCMVENEAYGRLLDAIRREMYQYASRLEAHSLPYDDYMEARSLGIQLREAEPVYELGLLYPAYEVIDPPEIEAPKGWKLSDGYRLDSRSWSDEEIKNIHTLSALGKFETPFIVVRISSQYDGYSWTNLPCVTSLQTTVGSTTHEGTLSGREVDVVSELELMVTTSDGKTWKSPVPIAVGASKSSFEAGPLYVTRRAQDLWFSNIWYFVDSYYDEGDTYETQEREFEEELDRFWAGVDGGVKEIIRRRLLRLAADICAANTQKVLIDISNESVTVWDADGTSVQIPKPA